MSHKRHLQLDSYSILWEHWYKAYQWDAYFNQLKVNQQLTQDHFFLTSQLQMPNRLVEDVMNQDMLHLMVCYQKPLGGDGEKLVSSDIPQSFKATLIHGLMKIVKTCSGFGHGKEKHKQNFA